MKNLKIISFAFLVVYSLVISILVLFLLLSMAWRDTAVIINLTDEGLDLVVEGEGDKNISVSARSQERYNFSSSDFYYGEDNLKIVGEELSINESGDFELIFFDPLTYVILDK